MFELYEGEKERRETTQKIHAVGAAVAVMKCHLTPLIARHRCAAGGSQTSELTSLPFRHSPPLIRGARSDIPPEQIKAMLSAKNMEDSTHLFLATLTISLTAQIFIDLSRFEQMTGAAAAAM